ncbi:MAG: tetratricopeptide repeat protein [Planctomycetota bacterium]|jgi:tetratricopeptide (TPR) repeat protein
MKKVLLIIIWFLFFAASAGFRSQEPLANDGKDGLYARSIEQVLRLEPEEIDLATAALIISENWSDIVQGRRYLTRLDDMAYEIRRRLSEKGLGANYKAVAVINNYLFDELGIKSVKEASDPYDLFLHSVLDRKRGYCLSLSMLYLSLGERLGLPLYGVVVPTHFFVRYDDGRVRFNIETTGEGGNASDEHYVDKFKVPEGDSIYMLNLNKRQTLGCFFNNLGNTYSGIDDTETAMVAFEIAVEINPSLAECRTNLGNIYLQKDRINDAIYEYEAALKINPGDAKTHNNIGNAYTKRGWLSNAISHYRESIGLDPNFTEAYRNLASVYSRDERYGQALVVLRQAIDLEPKNALLHSQLGDVYRQMGDCEKAIYQYEKALRLKGDLAAAYYSIGVCYNKLGMFEDEIKAYRRALSIEPGMAAALMSLGNAYFARKEYDAAIEQYMHFVKIKPDDGTIRYNLGAAYSNKGEYQQAVIEYRKAVEIEPKMGDAHNGLAIAFYNLKKYELAWEHIKTAEELGAEIDNSLLSAIEDKL